MKKGLYKLLAFSLCVCLVVGLVPAVSLTARAADAEAKIGEEEYEGTVADALRAATDGQTVEIVGETTTASDAINVAPGVTVKGKDAEFEFTAAYNSQNDPISVSVDAEGNVNVKNGLVDVGNGKKVNVLDTVYTAKGDAGATLAAFKSELGDEDFVELAEGSVEVPQSGKITVSKTEVVASDNAVTVTKDAESGIAKVEIESGKKAKIGDVECSGEATVIVSGGRISFAKGTVTVQALEDVGDDRIIIHSTKVTLYGEDGKTSGEVEVSNYGQGVVTVKVPVDEDNPNGQVTVPKGGAVSIGTKSYGVPRNATGDNNVLEFDMDFNVKLVEGSVELFANGGAAVGVNGATVEATAGIVNVTKDNAGGSAKMEIFEGRKAKVNGIEVEGPANVEIDKTGNATVTTAEGQDSVTVGGVKYSSNSDEAKGTVTITTEGKVASENMTPSITVPTAGAVYVPEGTTLSFEVDGKTTTVTGGEGGGYIYVDEDGSVTVFDAEGKELCGRYYNTGDDELKLTISSNDEGIVELKGGTVHVDGDNAITVGKYTYDSWGADIQYPGEGDDGIPSLKLRSGENGNVILDDGDAIKTDVDGGVYKVTKGTVRVTSGTRAYNEDPEKDAIIEYKAKNADDFDEYVLPYSGVESTYPDSYGNLVTPAQKKLTTEDSKVSGGDATVKAGSDSEGKVYLETPKHPERGESSKLTLKAGGEATVTAGGNSATFKNAGEEDVILNLDKDGNATLTEGSVTMSGENASIKADGIEGDNGVVTGDGVTVTVPGTDAEGSETDGADVKVPANGEVTIGDKTYKNGDSGELELHVAPNGDVSVKNGTVELGENQSVQAGGKTVTGSNNKDGKPAVTVTAPSDGSTNKTDVTVSGNGNNVTIGDVTYTGASESATLTVDNETGEVELKSGSVVVPEGGSVTVNGVEVKGPAKVTVDESGDAKVEPTTEGGSVTVGGVTYSDDPDVDGTANVTIDKDGNVSADGMIGSIETVPVSGLVVPAGKELTYKAGNKEVTLQGGTKDSKLDVAENGDITMYSGDLTIKGDVTTAKASDTDEDPTWRYAGDVTLQVKDETGKAVEGLTEDKVAVKYKDASGEEQVLDCDIEIGDNGTVTLKDVPYGTYTVEIEGANEKTSSKTVTVGGISANVSMTVETSMTVTTNVKGSASMTPAAAENLEGEVDSTDRGKADDADVNVSITLNVSNATTGTETDTIDTEVEKLLGDGEDVKDAVTDYIDVTVSKTVTVDGTKDENLSKEEISNTSSIITMRFPLSSGLKGKIDAGISAENIFVFRFHDSSAAKMRKVSPSVGKNAGFECYYIEVSADSDQTITIVVKANKFSVYAFGVASEPIDTQDPSTGGGGGGGASSGVNVTPTQHGTVTVTPSSPKAGDKVTVTVTPETGYDGSVTVRDGNGNVVTLTKNADGTYSFTMPATGVTVEGKFDECASLKFPDLDITQWYHPDTDFVIANGLMNGMADGTFKPNGTVNRAQVIMTLWNYEKNPVVNYAMSFTDVPEGEWYAEAVRWAASEHIVDGYNDGSFKPLKSVTREEMAVMLYRYEQYKGGGFKGAWTFNLTFADTAKISPWANEAVSWCTMNGIITGKDQNRFDPAGNAKRSELAAFLRRYLTLDRTEK